MRIDILVPVYIDTWNKGVWEEAQKTVSPDVDLHITNLEFGVPSLESMYDVAVASPYVVEKAIELEKDGSDGIIIYCMKEPALAAVKEKLGIPVIGLREATMGLIGVVGTHACILTSHENSYAQYRRELKGLIDKVDCLRMNVLDFADYETTQRKVEERVAAAVEDGCDIIVMGCGSILGLDFKKIEEKYKVSIVRPISCAISACEWMVRSGVRKSNLDYPTPDYKDIRVR